MPTVAIVGCAHIHAPSFFERIKKRSAFRVKSVWDHNEELGRRSAEELGAEFVADVSEIWSDPEIEVAIILSETKLHEELVIPAAQAGKTLFVEKPLGMGVEDAARMESAIQEAGVFFSTGYFMRGFAVVQMLKQLVDSGAFGQITRARGSNCHSGALGGWFDREYRWMADLDQAGIGAFGDLGTHSLDLLLWMFGEVEAATAVVGSGTNRYPGCDETGEGIIKFKNGVIATLAAAWDDVANPVTFQISGTEGHAIVINGELFIKGCGFDGADGKAPWKELPEEVAAGYDGFLDALENKPGADICTAAEAAYRSKVTEALYMGAREERWVKIEA